MTHRERILKAKNNEWLNRPCYTAWGPHYSLEETSAKDLARAMINFQNAWDFDFIKHMPSGMYFTEAFGQVMRTSKNMNVQSWMNVEKYAINDPSEWLHITPKKILDNSLAREVECVRRINDYYQGDVPVLPTVFSPYVWMGELTGAFFRQESIIQQTRYHEKEVRKGLEVVEETNQMLMEAFVDAGAAGFFLGYQVGMAEKMGRELFEEFEKKPAIRNILAVQDKTYFNMAHLCNGDAEHTEWFLEYPVDAFNWTDTHTEHHSLAEMRKLTDKVLVGGLDNQYEGQSHLDGGLMLDDFSGADRAEVKARIRKRVDDAIAQAGNGLVISGGCSFGFNAHHRFGVWEEVMDEVEAARAARQ